MASDLRAEDRAHRVLVYSVEAQLIEAGGSLVSDVLAAGGGAVVLATEEHLNALEGWVALCGPDVQAAAAAQRYKRFTLETVLDWLECSADAAAAFEAGLEGALEQIAPGVAPVVVVSEAAAALRERGQVGAALSLEAVSSALPATRPVSFLCAYHDGALAAEADVEQACSHHTAVLDPPAFPGPAPQTAAAVVSSAVLPPAPEACRTARQLVRAALHGESAADAIDIAELVVGELAANAVRHAGSTFTTEVLFSDGTARLAVTDAAPLPSDWSGFPVLGDHGLGLVAALASDWAVQGLSGGKVVWADLARGAA